MKNLSMQWLNLTLTPAGAQDNTTYSASVMPDAMLTSASILHQLECLAAHTMYCVVLN